MNKYQLETAAGLFVFTGLLFVAYLSVSLGGVKLWKDDSYTIYARFNNVSGLKENNRITIAGVPVGKVGGIRLDSGDMTALVALEIRDGIKVTDDSIASVMTMGLIGDKYISISPGGSSVVLGPGDTLYETESVIELEKLIKRFVFGTVEE